MRTKREGTGLVSGRQDHHDAAHRLSIPGSTSTGSSLLSDISRSEPLSSSSQSETIRLSPLPGSGHIRNISGGFCEFKPGGRFAQVGKLHPELPDEQGSRGVWQQDSATASKEAVETPELEAILHRAPGCGVPINVSRGTENKANICPQDSPLWAELSSGSDKKKNTTALNAVSTSSYFSFLYDSILLHRVDSVEAVSCFFFLSSVMLTHTLFDHKCS